MHLTTAFSSLYETYYVIDERSNLGIHLSILSSEVKYSTVKFICKALTVKYILTADQSAGQVERDGFEEFMTAQVRQPSLCVSSHAA